MSHELEGKYYQFEDGNSIEILQIKLRSDNKLWVHYSVKQVSCLPKKLIMDLDEFMVSFGHLFK